MSRYRDHEYDPGTQFPCTNPHCTTWVRGSGPQECIPCVDDVGAGAEARRAAQRTTVVCLRHEEYDVYAGRPGHGHEGWLGNPYRPTLGQLPGDTIPAFTAYFVLRMVREPEFKARVESLRGKRLGCFCELTHAPDGRVLCHAQIVADYLNQEGAWAPQKSS